MRGLKRLGAGTTAKRTRAHRNNTMLKLTCYPLSNSDNEALAAPDNSTGCNAAPSIQQCAANNCNSCGRRRTAGVAWFGARRLQPRSEHVYDSIHGLPQWSNCDGPTGAAASPDSRDDRTSTFDDYDDAASSQCHHDIIIRRFVIIW